jgi:hypothetical protein
MTRTYYSPRPAAPSICLPEGRHRLSILRDKGLELLAHRPLNQGEWETWSSTCLDAVYDTFGEDTEHARTFRVHIRLSVSDSLSYDSHAEQEDAQSIEHRCEILEALIKQIDFRVGSGSRLASAVVIPFNGFSSPSPVYQELQA